MTTLDTPATPPTTHVEKPKAPLPIWIIRAMVIIAFILAVIPPMLVVIDMWFRQIPNNLSKGVWCQFSFLCSSRLPSYFALIFGCLFILAIILFFLRNNAIVVQENPLSIFENLEVDPLQKRVGFCLIVIAGLGMILAVALSIANQHWPGWDLVIVWLLCLSGWALRAAPLTVLTNFWKKDGDFWVSLLLAHGAIVTVLAAYYNVPQVFYFSLIFLVLAFLNLWRFQQRVPTIFWIISVTLVFYTININGWWTAIIGDDQGFHELAWAFAEKMSFAQVGKSLFQANGVFGSHPYFASFMQAITMKLFGHSSFGWRFSNIYLCAIGVGLFCLFCRSFLPRRTALVAACLLGFSHYVMSFGKNGYDNLQALFALSLALATAAWALRWRQPFVYALLGSVMAFCFYLYPAALYVVPIPILLLLIYDPPKSRPAAVRWLVMVAVCVAMIYPLMMQPGYWQSKRDGTLFNRPELVQSVGVIVQHFASNIFYSILSFLYIPEEGHYVVASYVDPLTSVFIIIGYFVLLYQMRRQRFAIFTALAFMFFLFSVGASHDREVPSTTRMFLMLPWFALFGAWGVTWLDENIRKIGINSKTVLVPVLLVAIAATNLYQAYKISPMRYAATQSTATLFLALTENIQKAQPDKTRDMEVILQDKWGFETLLYFQDVYPYVDRFRLDPVAITEPVLPQDKMGVFSDPDTIVIVTPYIEAEWQNALDTPLLALGKTRCNIWIPDMRKLMVVYYSPELPSQICQFDTGLAVDEKIATGK
jgi:4-amino-4-deoxy-L-arabinose transferase-like glycosyltransferase